MSAFSVRPLQPFGVEVEFDLREKLADRQREELNRLRGEHHLLLFRRQSLSIERQMEVMGAFGPILMSRGDGYGYVSNVHPEGILGNTELEFHSDLDFSPLGAYYALSLHAVEVEDDRTSTIFCSAARAYDNLPSALKQRLLALEALDVQLQDMTGRNRFRDLGPDIPRCIHPLVRHLPLTGRPAIFASRSGTDSVMGMAEADSDALLGTLFDHLYDQSNRYEHRWRQGDLLVWDNRALQHCRGAVAPGTRRTLQRVTVAEPGTGFFDAFPQFRRESYASPSGTAASGVAA